MHSDEWLAGYRQGYNDHAKARSITYQMYGIRNGGEVDDSLFEMEAPSHREMTHACAGDACGVCHPDVRKGRHRRKDQPTSVAGAKSVEYRAGSQKARLLAAFEAAFPANLTDEEAAAAAGISLGSEFSKRCGELRQDGKIVQIEGRTRLGSAGVPRLVSVFAHGNSHLEGGTVTKESRDTQSDPVPVPPSASSPPCPDCGDKLVPNLSDYYAYGCLRCGWSG